MKKVASMCAALVLLASLCGAGAYAEGSTASSPNSGAPPDLAGGVVTDFNYERVLRSLETKTTSYMTDDLSELYKMLVQIEDILYCTVQLPSGDNAQAMCSAAWNITEISLDAAGSYDIVATLTPPEGCTLGEGVRTQIVLPVQMINAALPLPIVTIAAWNPYSLAVAVPQGSTLEAVTNNTLFRSYTTAALRCVDENGGVHNADISWDFQFLDLNTTGIYTITGTPIPPNGTAFADALVLPQPTATISVQAAGKPSLDCFYLLYPDVCFPWVAPPGDSDAVSVWLSEEGGAWQELVATSSAGTTIDSVWIAMRVLTKGKSYQAQVDYAGGQTGVLSFVWDDTIVITGYWEGDRDGDDGNGNPPPGVIQPPPNLDEGDGGGNENNGNATGEGKDTPPPAHEPSSEKQASSRQATSSIPVKEDAPAFLEESNATSTTISGLRLQLMREEDEGVQFFKQGIHVTLHREAVNALNLAHDDIFSIEILRESDAAFCFKVLVNEQSVTALAGTIVTLPYTPSSKAPALTVQHDQQKTITAGSYEPQSGLATFIVDAAGRYIILEEAVPTAASPSAEPSKPATIPVLLSILGISGLLVVGGGIWLFSRRSTR